MRPISSLVNPLPEHLLPEDVERNAELSESDKLVLQASVADTKVVLTALSGLYHLTHPSWIADAARSGQEKVNEILAAMLSPDRYSERRIEIAELREQVERAIDNYLIEFLGLALKELMDSSPNSVLRQNTLRSHATLIASAILSLQSKTSSTFTNLVSEVVSINEQ